jgi:(aminoalkyl)phosphonate N-acetyltransferase
METIVRNAGPEDLQFFYHSLCELEAETLDFNVFQTIYLDNIQNKNNVYCVLIEEDHAVGLLTLHCQMLLHHVGKVGEIQEFYIIESHRGKGYGKQLFDEMLKHTKALGLCGIEVTSNRKRIENVQVYQNLGFELTHNKFTKNLN